MPVSMPIPLVTPLPRPAAGPPVLALIVEGLRPEDLSRAHSPFLHRLRDGASLDAALRGAPGEQCWGEVFTGAWPERTGALAPWTLDPTDHLPVGRVSAWIQNTRDTVADPLRRLLSSRTASRSLGLRKLPPPPFVPMGLRRSLRAADDPGVYVRPGRATLPTLLDSLVAAGCRVELTAFPASPWDERRLIPRLGYMSRAFLDRHDLYLARLPGAERLVLHHGPGTPERHQLIRDLDGLVERLTTRFRRQWPDAPVLIASVRGSVAAQTYCDAGREVRILASRYGLHLYRDYALLVNRTLVRFWALSPAARSVLPFLEEEGHTLRRHGVTLTADQAARHRLPPPGIHAGDWIWFARPGVIVYPNDQDAERPRAATGYLFEPDENENLSMPRDAGAEAGERKPANSAGSRRNEHGQRNSTEGKEEPSRRAATGTLVDSGLLLLSAPASQTDEKTASPTRPAWRADLCVTLARLLDVRVPAAAQGKSLLPKTG